MKTTTLPTTDYGKTKTIFGSLLMFIALLVSFDTFADGDARRRNNCRNVDRKYFVDVKVNGPGCDRKRIDGRTCDDNGVSANVQNFKGDNCKPCYWYSGQGRTVAAEAWGNSSQSNLGTRATVFTDCRRYRAGSNNNSGNEINSTNDNGTPITNIADIYAGTDIYDYVNNTITLNNFGGSLHINTVNLINEYAIVKVEIFRINTDLNGVESEELITRSQAKIINGQFVSSQQSSFFSQNDFTLIQNNNEIQASFLFESKTINLNYDITEDMDIEIRMISDAGHIEDGESEVEVEPVSMIVSNTSNTQATFQILSDINRNGTLTVRNASGVILSTQSNIALTQNQTSEFTFNKSDGTTSPFYVVQFISSDAIIVVRKFVLY